MGELFCVSVDLEPGVLFWRGHWASSFVKVRLLNSPCQQVCNRSFENNAAPRQNRREARTGEGEWPSRHRSTYVDDWCARIEVTR